MASGSVDLGASFGGSPTGVAGGELSGTYPNPTIVATDAANASTVVRRDANSNAQFAALTMLNVGVNIDNVGMGGNPSASANYPLLMQRSSATPIVVQLSNPNTGAGSGCKDQLVADNGGNYAEMGIFAAATVAPDAYAGGNLTVRSSGSTAGIAIIADDVASAYIKLYCGGNGSGNKMAQVDAVSGLGVYRTITAGGTTGAQTINKIAGTVNFAAAATTLVVTNSMVTTSSIVLCTIRTDDATATIKNVVCASGSFTIKLTAAATAETSVGFLVLN